MTSIYNKITKLGQDKLCFHYLYKYCGCLISGMLCLIFRFSYNEAIGNLSLSLMIFSACIGGWIPGWINLFFTMFFLIDMSNFFDDKVIKHNLLIVILLYIILIITIVFKAVFKIYNNKVIEDKERYFKIINELSNAVLVSEYDKVIFYNKNCESILGNDIVTSKIRNFKSICSLLGIEKEIKPLKFKNNIIFVKTIMISNKEKKYRFHIEKKMYDRNEVIIIVIYDITKEIAQEMALLKAEKIYNNLLQKIPNGVVLHDDKKVILANDVFLEMVGVGKHQKIEGANIYRFIHKDYKGNLEKQINNVLNNDINETRGTYLQVLDNENNIIEVEVSSSKMPYYDKKMVSLFHNKTEVKNLTSEEKFLNEAINYEKMKLEFFANISHEFKTPLNILFTSIQTMEMYIKTSIIKDKSGMLQRYLKTMKQNCYRQLRLINNLIDITKLEAGFHNTNYRNVNIVEVVENITLSIVSFAEVKGVEVSFDTEEEEILIAIDEEKMERIILNLLSNAVKFTGQRDKIIVSITRDCDNVYISVKDTGVGIKEQDLPIVFSRFKQARNNALGEGQGSGIGLSLVKSFVDLHNGSIDLKSEEFKGTEFIITLPIKTIDDDLSSVESNSLISDNLNIEKINVEFSDIYY